jgi:hypothetical protein
MPKSAPARRGGGSPLRPTTNAVKQGGAPKPPVKKTSQPAPHRPQGR